MGFPVNGGGLPILAVATFRACPGRSRKDACEVDRILPDSSGVAPGQGGLGCMVQPVLARLGGFTMRR